MAADGPAAKAGMRVGDVVQRYSGISVLETRQFYGLVLDACPGTAEVELRGRLGGSHRRAGQETDTASRG
jgi:S1-C subfamily serine protease